MDALFERFDDDGSGYLDAPEAQAVLKQLQRRGIEATQTRDTKMRQATRLRLKATKMTDAVYNLPPINTSVLESVPEESALTGKKVPAGLVGLGDALSVSTSNSQADSDSQRDGRGSPHLSAREMRRRDKEREKRVKQITGQAVKRLPMKQIGKGFNAWRDSHRELVVLLEALRQGCIRLKSRQLVQGLVRWQEYRAERLWLAGQLGPALVKLGHRELSRGWQAWLVRWMDQLEINRLMAKAARSASLLKSPLLVGAFDVWHADGQLRSALHTHHRQRRQGGPVWGAFASQATLCTTLCASFRANIVATALAASALSRCLATGDRFNGVETSVERSALSSGERSATPRDEPSEVSASEAKAAAVAVAVAQRRRLGHPPASPQSSSLPAAPSSQSATPRTAEGPRNQSRLQAPGKTEAPVGEAWQLKVNIRDVEDALDA